MTTLSPSPSLEAACANMTLSVVIPAFNESARIGATVERVLAKLEGKHWMYKDSAARLNVIKMCENCRVAVMTETDFDPYGAPRQNPRTTDDYLRERERLKQE